MKFIISLLALFTLCLFSCNIIPDNLTDPANDKYVKPYIIVENTTLKGDTLYGDSLQFEISGNISGKNRYRYRLDTLNWNQWTTIGKTVKISRFIPLNDTGKHSFTISTCYDPSGDIVDSIIFFYRTNIAMLSPKWSMDTLKVNVFENQSLVLNLSDSCSDPNNDLLTFTKLSSTLANDSLGSDGKYRYNSTYSDSGTYFVKVIASDKIYSDTAIIKLRIINVNRKPLFLDSLPYLFYQISSNDTLRIKFKAVDPDNDQINYLLLNTNLPRSSEITFKDSILIWKPVLNDNGAYIVNIGAFDGRDTTVCKIDIGIGQVNLPPRIVIQNVIKGQSLIVKEMDTLKFTVTTTDPNLNDKVTLLPVLNAPFENTNNGSGTYDTVTGLFTFIPNFEVSTKSSQKTFQNITFRAKDNAGLIDTFALSITVLDSNRMLSITLLEPANGAKALPKNKLFRWSGSDPDGDSLTYSLYMGTISNQLEKIYDGKQNFFQNPSIFSYGTTYYYKITASDGTQTVESVIRSFSINNPPAVVIDLPLNNATNVGIPSLVSWTGTDIDVSDANQLKYSLYFAQFDSSYKRILSDSTRLSNLISNLSYNTKYKAKVVVSDGKDTIESQPISFTTFNPTANIRSLSLINATLAPAFNSGVTSYSASLPYEVDSLAIIVIPEDSLALMMFGADTLHSGSRYVCKNIAVGIDTIPIKVWGRDHITNLTYLIIVNRTKPNTFQKYFGRSGNDDGSDILQQSDSGFVVGGSLDRGSASGYTRIVKVNKAGDQVWSKQFGNSTPFAGVTKLQRASNGNTIVLSFGVKPDSMNTPHVWLFEIDNSGQILWEKTYRKYGYEEEWARSFIRTNDNGYLIVARAMSSQLSRADVWVIKTSPAGIIEWDSLYDAGGSYGDIQCMTKTIDGGYVIGGYKRPLSGTDSTWLFKINNVGKLVWSKTYTELNNGTIKDLQGSSDGSFYICGAMMSTNYNVDAFIGKVSSTGDIITLKKYTGDKDQNLVTIELTSDGNFILSGWKSNIDNGGAWDGWLVKANSACDTLWSRSMGSAGADRFSSARETYDGGFLISGYLYNSGMWILKTDRQGLIW